MKTDLHFLTVAEAARLIEKRQLSPVELVQTLLRRIETLDSQIHAFITLTADLALKQARQAETEIGAGRYRGPMHGIPFGLKDIYDTAGILTSGGSKVAAGNIPKEDATTVARLYEAGAVLVGKLNTHEFAHGGPSFDLPWPPARNPWSPAHFTGGSSSGSGAAVAAGFLPVALGTDTGGSIRTPSGLCGLAGIKPTYGLISRAGVIANSYTFDNSGPMAWTVEDCALLLQTLAGFDPKDPASARRPIPDYRTALNLDIRGMRIGVIRHFWEEDLPAHEEARQAMEAAIDVFSHLGARVENARMRPMQEYSDVKVVIAESELFSVHQRNLRERASDFGFDFLGRVLPACLFQAPDYVRAQRRHRRLLMEMLPLYEKYDLLLAYNSGPAPRLDEVQTRSFWRGAKPARVFNVTGGPTLALCNGFSRSGLPLSMQLSGKPFDEMAVLRAGHAYEKATPWRNRRPLLAEGKAPVPIIPADNTPRTGWVDGSTRQLAKKMADHAGLNLTELQFEQLCEAAPYTREMARRISCDPKWEDGPANIFSFPSEEKASG